MRKMFLTALAMFTFCLAFAESNAEEPGTIVLTINGAIAAGDPVDLTMEQIEEIGSAEITTTTPWHDGPVTFSGVPMAELLKQVGASSNTIGVLALNNYRTEIPVSDFEKFGVILATRKNGEYMPISDKGPLFIIYPYDSDNELKSEIYYSRSAWQVRSITIE